jgi:uncharacterized protein YjbJ (UPF0337 family)
MKSDILEGKWLQLRGRMKEWWGKLTDDDLDKIQGKRDRLIGALQEKYGYAKRKAEEEIASRLDRLEELDEEDEEELQDAPARGRLKAND